MYPQGNDPRIRLFLNYLRSLSNDHGHTQPQQGFRPPDIAFHQRITEAARFLEARLPDPLARIRHVAFDIVALLHELEESTRLPL